MECVTARQEGLLQLLLPLPLLLPLLPSGPYASARQRPGEAWQWLEAARLEAPGSRQR